MSFLRGRQANQKNLRPVGMFFLLLLLSYCFACFLCEKEMSGVQSCTALWSIDSTSYWNTFADKGFYLWAECSFPNQIEDIDISQDCSYVRLHLRRNQRSTMKRRQQEVHNTYSSSCLLPVFWKSLWTNNLKLKSNRRNGWIIFWWHLLVT